jgi:hypothetical protein
MALKMMKGMKGRMKRLRMGRVVKRGLGVGEGRVGWLEWLLMRGMWRGFWWRGGIGRAKGKEREGE